MGRLVNINKVEKLPSIQPEFTNEEIRFALKQLRVYFAIKIRDGKEGSIPIELSQLVKEIQKYFENGSSAQPETAQWVQMRINNNMYKCSNCQNAWNKRLVFDNEGYSENIFMKYCPCCGRKMKAKVDYE